MILSKISLSDSNFSKKILRKYQKGKWNFLNFPFMVFGNNLKHIFPQKFNINLLIQLNFHNQRMINHVINKSIEGMKEWVSGIEKIFTEFIYRPNIFKIINDTKKSITFQHGTISGFPASMYRFVPGQSNNSIIFPNILFYKSCMEASNAIFSESAFSYSLSNKILRHFLMNYGSTSVGQINNNIVSSNLIDQSSHLLLYRNLSLNKILQNTALNPRNITLSSDALFNQIQIYGNNSQMREIGHKTILLNFRTTGKYYSSQNKKDSIKNSSNSLSSISMQRRDVQNNDNFYFQNNKQLDQKIEQIKKISQEAKEIVAQKVLSGSSGKSEMQPEIDINRLSNKVYKMIEYNMKIEKERRGYL